jgi:hypothetical protein
MRRDRIPRAAPVPPASFGPSGHRSPVYRPARSHPRARHSRDAGRDRHRIPRWRDRRGNCPEISDRDIGGRLSGDRSLPEPTAEIDAYRSQRQAEAVALQREIEKRFDPVGVRARLIARRTAEHADK